MNKKRILIVLLLSVLLLLGGCGSSSAEQEEADGQEQETVVSLEDRDKNICSYLAFEGSMDLEYAQEFAVDYYRDGYMLFTIADGSRFLIVPENCETPEQLPEDIVVLQQPLRNLYVVAPAAMDMLRELNALDAIRFSGKKEEDWYIEEAKAKMASGEILYAGKYSMPDYELILSEGCSLAIENNMISHSPEVREKLEEFGIPVFVDFSSYETHPLGRVEWIKLYGALTGRERESKEAFQKQTEILERVTRDEKTDKTVAFFYITSNGAVNVRRSSDYIPKMIELAGGSYIFKNLGTEEDKKNTFNMQMEEFYKEAKEADYLIYNSTIDGEIETVEELLQKSEMLKDFKAVKEGNVWCTTCDLYQQSMSIGKFLEDIHDMLSGDTENQEEMQYLYLLK